MALGGLAWTIVAFVVALSIIVTVHEYGHYIVGRWCGIHAEVFSLGFGPVLLSRTDRRGTRWQIAALPFGGYVKFLGDASAVSDRPSPELEFLTESERRHSLHGAPLWARAATVAAGPVFNFILSIAVFAGFFLIQGVATDVPTVGSVRSLPGIEDGLKPGDRILAIGDTPAADFAAIGQAADALPAAATVPYRVERDGQKIVVQGPFPLPPVVDGVQPKSAAMDAGLKPGDVIQSVNGTPVHAFTQLREIVGASGGNPLTLSVWRNGESFDATLTPIRRDIPKADGGFETRWLIGLTGGLAFDPETRRPGPLEALKLAGEQTWSVVTTSLSGMAHIISGAISSCNISGPLTIAETSGAAASLGLASFIGFVAMLSTAVGLLNLFPIPVLDGGHLVFHVWEALTGKPPSDRALRLLMGTGLALLAGLMAFALTNDLTCP